MTQGSVQAPSMPSDQKGGLTSIQLWILFPLLLLIVFSRRPGDLLHAQFYAEDGARWFQQAYNYGWLPSLPIPDASYLQLLPRLVTGFALLVPLRLAPLILNLGGAALEALPVVALLSRRCATWGSLPLRCGLAIVYLANPNASEIHVNITNAQWHFALLQVLLVFGLPPRTWLGKTSDILVFVIGSVSGPFDAVLLGILLLSWLLERDRWTLVLAAFLVPGTLLQFHTLLTGNAFSFLHTHASGFARSQMNHLPLGATPSLFIRLVGGNIFMDSLIGYNKLDRSHLFIAAAFFLVGLFVIGDALRWGSRGFRFLALFTFILFVASLKSPVIDDGVSRWHALHADGGMRYYFLPGLIFLWSAVYGLSRSATTAVRAVCLLCLLLFILGAADRWRYLPYPDHHFNAVARQVEEAAPGQLITFPIQPAPWTITLERH